MFGHLGAHRDPIEAHRHRPHAARLNLLTEPFLMEAVHDIGRQLIGGFAAGPDDPANRAGDVDDGGHQAVNVVVLAALELGVTHDTRRRARELRGAPREPDEHRGFTGACALTLQRTENLSHAHSGTETYRFRGSSPRSGLAPAPPADRTATARSPPTSDSAGPWTRSGRSGQASTRQSDRRPH